MRPKIIKIKKVFYAIGQGCFYSERLFFENEIRTIVYDCGSMQIEKLKKEISNSGLKEIDYLIISHFHKDHINGIEFLKQNCTIKNVIIPKLEPLDVAFYLGSGNTIEDILINPKNYFGNSNIIMVNSEGESNELDTDTNLPSEITHMTPIPLYRIDSKIVWVIKLYIDKLEIDLNSLNDKQKETYDSLTTIDNYEKKKQDLIDAYKKLSRKNINLTSMSMVSGPKPHLWPYHHKMAISVLNGDILLNKEEKIKAFIDHYTEFGSHYFDFHIPHHGSHKNLKRPLNEWIIQRGIVMSGYENDHGHPSGVVLRKFSDSRIPVKKLTEFDKNYSKLIKFYV